MPAKYMKKRNELMSCQNIISAIVFVLLLFGSSAYAYPINKEEISRFYRKVIPEKKTISVSMLNEVQEVDYLLIATEDIEVGKYEVSVTRIDGHIYKIDDTNIYIEMPYCYEYSYGDEAILEVFSYMGHTFGDLIFIED